MTRSLYIVALLISLGLPGLTASGEPAFNSTFAEMLKSSATHEDFREGVDSIWRARFGTQVSRWSMDHPDVLAVGANLTRYRYWLSGDSAGAIVRLYIDGDSLLAATWSFMYLPGSSSRQLDSSVFQHVYRPGRLAAVRQGLRTRTGLNATRFIGDSALMHSVREGEGMHFGYVCGMVGHVPVARQIVRRMLENGRRDSIALLLGSLDPELRMYGYEAFLAFNNLPPASPSSCEILAVVLDGGSVRSCSGCRFGSFNAAEFQEHFLDGEERDWGRHFDLDRRR